MRRNDREVKDFDEIINIIERCDVCRLALNDKDFPYILPLNFGMEVKENKIVLYFHGAAQGRKYDLIARDKRASFEMDCSHELILDEAKGSCAMTYESVIGRGYIDIVPDEEKYDALCTLMRHYRQENFPFNQAMIPSTTVLRLTVEEITGKKR